MPMSKPTLSALIKSKITATATVTDDAELVKFCDALADAIVTHILASALVTLTTATVTSGAGSGGLVAGTGVIT